MTAPYLKEPALKDLGLKELAPGLKSIATDAPVDLWLLDHGAPFDPDLLSWLSEEEWSRARRFHFSRHRRRYLAAHAVLRGLVAERAGVPPSALRFDHGTNGKPFLHGQNAPHVSLSYSPGLCLIGIGHGPAIGVDIEQSRIIADAEELAALYFTRHERRALNRMANERDRSLAFLHGWTRKEACLKAMGTGLAYPASSLETGLFSRRTVVTLRSGTRVETASLMIERHVISWARLLFPAHAKVHWE